MAKPILLINYPIQSCYDDYERLVVKLQEQLTDYHVIGLPKTKGELEVSVKSAEYVTEYAILEAKELIMTAVSTYFHKEQNLN